jgi:hypothetical protein
MGYMEWRKFYKSKEPLAQDEATISPAFFGLD